jgi:hypothetical protein
MNRARRPLRFLLAPVRLVAGASLAVMNRARRPLRFLLAPVRLVAGASLAAMNRARASSCGVL